MITENTNDFRVLCVTPSLDGKMLFKQSASRIREITALSLADSLLEAEQRLRQGAPCHSIYVSSYFQIEVIKEFSSSARSTESGKAASYMLILQDEDEMQPKADLKPELIGFDGVLTCPYSRWTLSKSIQTAKRIHLDRNERIKHAQLEMMVGKLLSTVDKAAYQSPEAPNSELNKAKKIIGTIQNFSEGLKEEYFETLDRKAQEAAPRTDLKDISTPPANTSRIIRKNRK